MLYNRALESALYITQSNLDEAMTYNNIGCLQRAEGKLSEAIDSFERALRLNPALTVCMSNLANAYLDAARHHDMLKQFEVALNSSSNQLIFANMLMGLLYPDGIDPLSIRARHEEWAARFCPAATKPQAFSDDREPLVSPNGSLRRLRVGYLTSDLREHASLKFLLPVLLHHSADVEVFVYASVRRPDAATAFCQSRFPHLTFVAHMSDQQLNDCIRSDRLDILIELNGHTENNRLSALAVKPAPVVCSWLGYPATTGMRSIDYRFVDRWTDPDELQAHCTEKLIRLQLGFNCYESLHPLPHVSASPLLRNGYVTFGSASNTRKLSTQTLSSWAAVLQAVPSARLSLKSSWFDDSSTRTHVTESLARYGLDPARLAFFGYLPGEDAHLKFYNEVDIALDTFPYNGTTTTCDALLMGVPVVTIRGSSHVSRVSFSILERVGVSELAAKNPDEFISIAQQLATDRSRLISLRNSLRSCFQSSSLGQHHTFVAHLEEVYRQLCGA
jgi:predicted O-linked N-acetylglucosamine transferase (SPINDLY family)